MGGQGREGAVGEGVLCMISWHCWPGKRAGEITSRGRGGVGGGRASGGHNKRKRQKVTLKGKKEILNPKLAPKPAAAAAGHNSRKNKPWAPEESPEEKDAHKITSTA